MKEKIRNEARVVTKGRECENDNGLHRFQFALLGYHGARILIQAAKHKQSYVSVTIALHSDGIFFRFVFVVHFENISINPRISIYLLRNFVCSVYH